MGEVEIVVKVPEGVDPETIVRKAKALAVWESILASSRKRRKHSQVKLTGTAEEFERFVGEGEEGDLC